MERNRKTAARQHGSSRKKRSLMPALYAILVISIAAYVLTENQAAGLLVFIIIIAILIAETRKSRSKERTKRTAIEMALALGTVVVIWILLILYLDTTAPIDAVASCSMLPILHRGDLVALHGISNFTEFVESEHIPVVNVSSAEFSAFESSIDNEFISYYAYAKGNKSDISYLLPVGASTNSYGIGLYNTKCLSNYSHTGQAYNYYKCYVPNQNGNMIKYNYSIGNITIGGKLMNVVYTSSISILNKTIYANYSMPIIAYRTTGQDSFSGDIIHRVFAAIRTGNTYYFLTKGDNNQALDIEFANYPPSDGSIVGRVIADVPAIGYLKLIISGQFAAPQGCNQTILH
ncbi:MAG: hypothetical protein QXV17_10310 [Candidatus Micrarchaeaceae archaeon]